ncbi:cystathione beta-lyase [Williamsoniiplasma somnilux]|uniref:cysteine-S-conjugate beta-lyase n=1 Tax=Williamsoniiplasma somnilux TaxID=215578 RepID=A0A2K8NZR7_9MOLU|nr:aminotransferase class I/II-fold pyridoxal phosphate-dependent enzyme [Williamsoniiplasma somnilux]ATZ18708.1 cystathione beta-lyase [Williamsoniiplasma somnilux]
MRKEFQNNFDRTKTQERKSDKNYIERTFQIDKNKKIINSTIADFDFQTPKPIIEAILERAKKGTYSYTYVTDDFYYAVKLWYKKNYQVSLNSKQIKLVHGTVNALHQLIMGLSNEGDSVIINTPVYGPFLRAIKNSNRLPIFSDLIWNTNGYLFNIEDFKLKIKNFKPKIFILCNPHNPGGVVWNKKLLIQILEICRKNNVLLVSDEVHADLTLKGKKFTSLINLMNQDDQVIICNSANKTFNLGGLKSSYLISKNKMLLSKINNIFESNSLTSPNVFSIPAISAAYTNSETQKWLDDFKDFILENFKLLQKKLQNLSNLEIMNLESSYLVWCKFKNISYLEFTAKAKESGVIFSDYNDFANCSENLFRINIGCSQKTLNKICKILNKILS